MYDGYKLKNWMCQSEGNWVRNTNPKVEKKSAQYFWKNHLVNKGIWS